MAECKIFPPNANRDVMQITARHESLPCCIKLEKSRGSSLGKISYPVLKSSDASPFNQGNTLIANILGNVYC